MEDNVKSGTHMKSQVNSSDDNDGSHIWMRETITEAFQAAKKS